MGSSAAAQIHILGVTAFPSSSSSKKRSSSGNNNNGYRLNVSGGFGCSALLKQVSYRVVRDESGYVKLAIGKHQFAEEISAQKFRAEKMRCLISNNHGDFFSDPLINEDVENANRPLTWMCASSCGAMTWLSSAQAAHSSEEIRINSVYEIGELFELGIQLSYLLLLLGLLGAGTFFVIRQVLVRRELDLSAKELQEQIRSGDANATELFELGAVMLRRKFYPAATKYLLQAISKWDGDDQDLAQVYNALGVSYVRDDKLDKGIAMFENAVKLQPGYVIAWNNLGDAYEKKKDLKSALKAFEEVLLFDPNNKLAQPRRDSLKERVQMYKGVSFKSKKNV